MKQTGQLLKNARNEQDLSLTEVSMATKISPKILMAIEEGDLKNLPAKTFLRGFVRSYAAFLKIDLDLILQTFQDEMGSTLAEPQIESTQPDPSWAGTPLPQLTDRVSLNKVVAVAGIIVLIIAIVFVRSLVQKYEQEATIAELPAELAQITTEEADAEVVEEPQAEEKPPQVEKPPQEEPAAAVSPAVPTASQPKVQEPQVEVPPADPLPSMEVTFEALDRVQISFRIGTQRPQQISLEPDQVHSLRAQGVLNVELSDGGAVNIIYNGRDLGVPGDLGRPKRLRFP